MKKYKQISITVGGFRVFSSRLDSPHEDKHRRNTRCSGRNRQSSPNLSEGASSNEAVGAAGKSNKETLRLARTDGINRPVAERTRLWLQP